MRTQEVAFKQLASSRATIPPNETPQTTVGSSWFTVQLNLAAYDAMDSFAIGGIQSTTIAVGSSGSNRSKIR